MNLPNRIIRKAFWLLSLLMMQCCDVVPQNHAAGSEGYQQRLKIMEKSGVVAGPSEKTFEESHGIKLHLPMPADEFLRTLHRLKLRYSVYAKRNTKEPIPAPWHSDKLNLDSIRRVYQIYGNVDATQQSREMYRAYEDKTGQIVYLENTFVYAGP